MANKKRSEIRASARDILLDEFEEGVDLEFEDDYLNRIVRITLDEVENKMPYEVKTIGLDDISTIATTALTATATNLTVASDDDFSTTYPKYYAIEGEVIAITALASADNFTITRGQLGSTAATHAVGKGVGLAIITTANSKDIDISEITNLIRLRNWRPVEFEVGKNPIRWRNCFVFANTLTLDIDFLPSGNEAVYLYCLKKHTLTDAASTVGATAASILLKGVCGRAAQGKGRLQINSLNTGGVNVGPRMIEVGKMWMDEYKKALKTEALEDNYEVLPRGVS